PRRAPRACARWRSSSAPRAASCTCRPSRSRRARRMRVSVLGAGVAGLTCALELAERGAEVEVLERAPQLAAAGCSWYAGGMLAPWCERESSAALIAELGAEGLAWWRARFPGTATRGTLVLAHGRDLAELGQFARRTAHYQRLDAAALASLDPELAGRFAHGLHFADEGHLDPRAALEFLARELAARAVPLRFGHDASAPPAKGRVLLDCRGFAAHEALVDLRGVKGEMLLLRL